MAAGLDGVLAQNAGLPDDLRNLVYPRLGFDTFLDIHAFDGVAHAGPYMDDGAVADQVAAIVRKSSGPVFVLAITMENHGPLHLEKIAPGDIEALYSRPPPVGCDDLTIYLRHLRNADRMAAKLRQTLEQSDRPASLCWYGDHVPIMPSVYQAFGTPKGVVPYVCWSNRHISSSRAEHLAAEDLSMRWLHEMRMV